MNIVHEPGCPAARVERFTATRPGEVVAKPIAWPGRGFRIDRATPPGAVRLVRGPSTPVSVRRCIECGGASYDPSLAPPVGPNTWAPPPAAGSGRLAHGTLRGPRPQR